MKLSIIVPIYNVEQYLRKCVDSLLNQDIDDYEIILVDDGSTDNSGAICDEYAEKAKSEELRGQSVSIRVIHRENGGLSAARNSGIEVAQGKYIMFVDSDDYIEPNVLGGLMARIERDNLDVLRYNYQNVRIAKSEELRGKSEYEVFEPYRAAKRDVDYSESVTNGEDFLNNRLGPMCYAVVFVLKRELLDDCIFKEGIYFEDVEWTPRLLLKTNRVSSTNTIVYNYLWRSGSITLPTDPIKRKKVIEDKMALIRGFKEQCTIVTDPQWFTWMTSSTAMTILKMLVALPSSERKPYIKELKSLHIFPLSIKREKVLSHKMKTIMANISPSIYCNLMSLRK